MEKAVVKIDRNGTKYYHDWTCPRCGGAGGYEGWIYTGYTCYACGGTGRRARPRVVKEYTPEYEAKLAAKRRARAEQKEREHQAQLGSIRKEWLLRHGFTADGQTFVFVEDVYDRKEEIKAAGAKFDIALGWHIDHQLEGFLFIVTNISDVANEAYSGYHLTASREDWDSRKKQTLKGLNLIPTSEHIGEIGQRLTLKVTYIHTASWDNQFGTQYIHKFVDESGNILTWKTTSYIPEQYQTEFTLTGTVKEHSEYKGDKQTVMARCKLN